MTCEANESANAFQKLMDALGEIGCTKFFTKEEINSLPEHDKKMEEAFYKMVVEPLRKWLNDEKQGDKMTDRNAMWYLSKLLDESDNVATKRALSKGIMALRNKLGRNAYFQIGEGYPIVYFTNKDLKCHVGKDGEVTVLADNREIFKVQRLDEHSRGGRYEVAVHDNSIKEDVFWTIVVPRIYEGGVSVYDDYDPKTTAEVMGGMDVDYPKFSKEF